MWAVYVFLIAFILWQRFSPPDPNKIDVNWAAITPRRVLGFAGLFLLLLMLPHLMAAGLDLPFLLSLDLTFLTDLTALLIMMGVQEYIRPVNTIFRKTLSALHLVRRKVIRIVSRARRTRPLKALTPLSGEEEDGDWVFA